MHCWKKTIEPCPKHNSKCNGYNGIIVLILMGTLMVSTGIWWILLGGMLNPIEKCPKHTTKRNYVMVLLEKANGILMETIGISVMVSIGIL